MTAEDFKKEFYKLGCTFGVYAAEDQTYLTLSGLNENMEKALQLFEKLLAKPKPDDEALKKMVDGIFKEREDSKKDKGTIMFEGLISYGLYGAESPFTNVLSNKELREVKAEELVKLITNFSKTEHRVLSMDLKGERLITLLNHHALPDKLNPVPQPRNMKCRMYQSQQFTGPIIYGTGRVMFLSKGDL
jgi:hypothetical protein